MSHFFAGSGAGAMVCAVGFMGSRSEEKPYRTKSIFGRFCPQVRYNTNIIFLRKYNLIHLQSRQIKCPEARILIIKIYNTFTTSPPRVGKTRGTVFTSVNIAATTLLYLASVSSVL